MATRYFEDFDTTAIDDGDSRYIELFHGRFEERDGDLYDLNDDDALVDPEPYTEVLAWDDDTDTRFRVHEIGRKIREHMEELEAS